ncbi:MAG: YIP1 family protein [Candidatus Micrarchaeia archaeon]
MDLRGRFDRIRENILFVPAERFDSLAGGDGFNDSAAHLVLCLLLSVPIDLAVGALGGTLIQAMLSVPSSLVISLMLSYLIFAVQHLLLKLVGGHARLSESVSVFIYGNTVSLVFGGIPFLGIAAVFISLSNVVIGSARVHRIPLWRSALALVVLPGILLALILLYIFVTLPPGSSPAIPPAP